MELAALLVYLQLLVLRNSECKRLESKSPQAIAKILDFLSETSWTINIVYFKSNSGNSEELFDLALQLVKEPSVIQVLKVSENEPRKVRLSKPSALVFHSLQTFNNSFPKIMWQTNLKLRRKHLVSIAGLTYDDLKNIRQ